MDELIILKYLNQTASKAEITLVEEWLSQTDANKEEFERLKKLLKASEQLSDYQTFDKKAAWEKVKLAAMEESSSSNKKGRIRHLSSSRTSPQKKSNFLFRVAAIVLVFFMITVTFYLNYSADNPSSTLSYKTVESQDKLLKISMPDGSTVWLNQNSHLKYPTVFEGKNRTVVLEGEAFFEVTENPEKPFIIDVGDTNVKVLGTSFNVNSRSEKHIEVTVETGKVQFYSKKNEQNKVILEKQEKGVFDNAQFEKVAHTNRNFMAWKTGILEFQDESLSQTIAVVNHHYGTQIQLEKNSSIAHCKVNNTFDNQPIEEILEELQVFFRFTYTSESGRYLLKGGACKQ